MTPLQLAAQFAAFVWYTNNRQAPGRIIQEEARRFAEDNWQSFLPIANEGLGRLLLRVSKTPATRQNRVAPAKHRSTRHELAAAG